MTIPQQAVSSNLSNPRAGTLAYGAGYPNVVVTGWSAAIAYFGQWLSKGTADQQVKTPAASTDVVGAQSDFENSIGVCVATQTQESLRDALNPHYIANTALNILRRGAIWVVSEQDVVAYTSRLYVRYTVNGGLIPGSFRTDADGGKAAEVTAKVRPVTTATAGNPFKIEVNLP